MIAAALAYFSMRLAWQSYTFHDISQGADATALWIPQLTMVAGSFVMLVAFLDDFVSLVRGRPNALQSPHSADAEPAHIE